MICFIYPRSIALPPLLTHSLIDDEDSILERSSATKDDWARAPHHHPLDKKIVKLKKKRPKTQFWGVCGQYSWIYIDRWLALSLSLSPLLEQSNSSETTNWDTKRYRDRISYAFRFFRFYERLFFWRLSIFWQKQNKWFNYDKDLQHVTINLIQPIVSQQIFYVHDK